MPIHGYPGNVITANPTAPTVSSASGVWTTEQQLINQSAGNWPMAQTQISLSARFNSADSAYLSRTPATAGNRTTWTFSFWVKRSSLSDAYRRILTVGSAGSTSNLTALQFRSATDGNTLQLARWDSGSTFSDSYTTAVFRDVSAWYHFVVVWDTSNSTASDRFIVYVNGSRQTLSGTNPSLNQTTSINSTAAHYIGKYAYANDGFFDGYLAEVNFIDGLALTPAYFGFNNSDTGAWTPKQYTGAYGTNGFYLQFNKEGIGVDFLVVAGGGGGGGCPGGSQNGGSGGGGGGYRTSAGTSGGGASAESALVLFPGVAYTVTVGAGGAGGASTSGAVAGSGNNSVFSTITSAGGGGGASSNGNGASGGSGGGGAGNGPGTGGSGTANQGYAGGPGSNSSCAGGGGAGGVGGGTGASSTTGFAGGVGVSSSITGSSVGRGGGGGGGGYNTGGGGTTATDGGGAQNVAGTANRGGGGGGFAPGNGGGPASGAAGGSGVVIIKIPDTYTATFSGGVTQTSTTSGGFKIYTVTATSTTSETVTFS